MSVLGMYIYIYHLSLLYSSINNHLYSLYHLYPQRSKNLIIISLWPWQGCDKKKPFQGGFSFLFLLSTCTAGHRRSWKALDFFSKRRTRWIFRWKRLLPWKFMEKYLVFPRYFFRIHGTLVLKYYKYLVWLAIPWKITHLALKNLYCYDFLPILTHNRKYTWKNLNILISNHIAFLL